MTYATCLLAQFCIFVYYPLQKNPPVNFRFLCSAYPHIIIRGFPKCRSRSRDLDHALFGPFYIFVQYPLPYKLYPSAKLEVCSFSLSMGNRGNKISKVRHVTQVTPHFYPFLFCFVYYSLYPQSACKICGLYFDLLTNNRAVPKFKSRSRNLGHTLFGTILIFFVQFSLSLIHLQNLRFVASACPQIIGGSKI